MKDEDSVRIAMEQAMTGLFSRVRDLSQSDASIEDFKRIEILLREAWIDQCALSHSLGVQVGTARARNMIVLEALEDIAGLVSAEGKAQALEIVGVMSQKLREVGEDERDSG